MRASRRAQWSEARWRAGSLRGEHAGVVMPMPPRQRNQRGEPVEPFEWREGELGLAGGQGYCEGVANRLVGSTPAEPLTGEGGAGAVAQRAIRTDAEHAVGDAAVQVGMGVERRAEALHETDRAKTRVARRMRAAASQCRLDRAQYAAAHAAKQRRVAATARGPRYSAWIQSVIGELWVATHFQEPSGILIQVSVQRSGAKGLPLALVPSATKPPVAMAVSPNTRTFTSG